MELTSRYDLTPEQQDNIPLASALHLSLIHIYVGQRRDCKEVEGGLAVAKGREDAGGNVVEEHEGQAQNVDEIGRAHV